MRDPYERVMALAKILLPISALILLSSLFLFAKTTSPEDRFTLAEGGEAPGEATRGLTVAGMSNAGNEVELRAALAVPDGAHVALEEVEAEIKDAASGQTRITARRGAAALSGAQVSLREDVLIASSGGFRLRSEALDADLAAGRYVSPGPVQGDGPFGRFSAGNMLLQTDPEGGAQHLLFRDGVDLIYEGQVSGGKGP